MRSSGAAALWIAVVVLLAACGGSGKGALPKKGALYSGKTSDNQPVLLHVSARGGRGIFDLSFRALGSCGAGSKPSGGLEHVRISLAGEIISAPLAGEEGFASAYGIKPKRGVLGSFVSKSRVEGELPDGKVDEGGGLVCTIHIGSWEAELEKAGSRTPTALERRVAARLKVPARQVWCAWEGSLVEADSDNPLGFVDNVYGCQRYGQVQGRCYLAGGDGEDVTQRVRRSLEPGGLLCDD